MELSNTVELLLEELLNERNIFFEKKDISSYFIDMRGLSRKNKAFLLALTNIKNIGEVTISLLQEENIGYLISFHDVISIQDKNNLIEILSTLEHQDVITGRLTLEQFLKEFDSYLEKADEHTKYQYNKGVYTEELIEKFNRRFQTDYVICPSEGTYWQNRTDYEKHVKYLQYRKNGE